MSPHIFNIAAFRCKDTSAIAEFNCHHAVWNGQDIMQDDLLCTVFTSMIVHRNACEFGAGGLAKSKFGAPAEQDTRDNAVGPRHT